MGLAVGGVFPSLPSISLRSCDRSARLGDRFTYIVDRYVDLLECCTHKFFIGLALGRKSVTTDVRRNPDVERSQ